MTQQQSLLSPKQRAAIKDRSHRITIFDGAVSSGKTYSSLWSMLAGVKDASTLGEIVIIGKTIQTVGRNIFTQLMNPELFGSVLSSQVSYRMGASVAQIMGRTVHVIGANDSLAETKIRGMTISYAYVDEATLLPESFWDMLDSRMRAPNAKILATTNPDSPRHWLRKNWILNEALDLRLHHFVMSDNEHLDPVYVDAMKKRHKGMWYKRFIEGLWVAAEGVVYSMFDPDSQVVTTDALPAMQEVWIGGDHGTADPTVILLMGLGMDDRLYILGEWAQDGRATGYQSPVQQSAAAIKWVNQQRPLNLMAEQIEWVIDCAAAAFIAQLRQDHMTVRASTKGAGSVVSGIQLLSSLFSMNKLMIHESCKNLIDELQSYAWDAKAAQDGIDKPLHDSSHGPDALRYGLYTKRHQWNHAVGLTLVPSTD